MKIVERKILKIREVEPKKNLHLKNVVKYRNIHNFDQTTVQQSILRKYTVYHVYIILCKVRKFASSQQDQRTRQLILIESYCNY